MEDNLFRLNISNLLYLSFNGDNIDKKYTLQLIQINRMKDYLNKEEICLHGRLCSTFSFAFQ